jgi:hypothetical protein
MQLCLLLAALGGSSGQLQAQTPASPVNAGSAFHVFLLLGQSNMAGYQQALDTDRMADPRILALGFDDCPAAGRSEGEWSVALPPLHECWNGALGPGDSFARSMLQAYPPGDSIGLVPSALSGQAVETFMKGVAGSRYDWILARARAAIDAGGVIEGILYHQGESNCGDESWPANVATFITDLRQDLGLASDLPLLAGELLYSGNCARHNPLVHRIPDHLAGAYVVSAEGLAMADGDPWRLHFSREAEIALGQRYAETMKTLLER